MSMRNRQFILGVVCVTAVALAAGWLSQSDKLTAQSDAKKLGKSSEKPTKPADKQLPIPARDQAAMKGLDSTVPISFKATPIKDVLAYLEKETNGDLSFLLDEDSLKKYEFEPKVFLDDPVTMAHKRGLKIRKLLRMILGSRGLGYYLDDGLVVIASRQTAEMRLITMVYPISNLIGGPRLVKLASDELLDGLNDGPAHQLVNRNYKALAFELAGTIAPEEWEPNGKGSIAYIPTAGSLSIRTTREVHYLIQASGLLDNNRAVPVGDTGPSEKELKTVVIQVHSVAGLLHDKNLERSRSELAKALALVVPADKNATDIVFLTDARLIVVRQPLEVQLRIERLLAQIHSRTGARSIVPQPSGLPGLGGLPIPGSQSNAPGGGPSSLDELFGPPKRPK